MVSKEYLAVIIGMGLVTFLRQGIGGRLLKEALNYSRSQGLTHATLHASQSGKSLYESFGFKDTNEMRLAL